MPLIRPERPALRDVSPVTIGIAVVLVAGLVATFGVLRSASGHGSRSAIAATTTTARSAPGTTAASAPSKSKTKAQATGSSSTATTSGLAAAPKPHVASSASNGKRRTTLAAKREGVRRELRRVTRDLALVQRAERALRAATKLQPSATVDAAIKQLDARATALQKQQSALRATLQSLHPTPSKPKPKAKAASPPTPKPTQKPKPKHRVAANKGQAGVHLPMTLTAALKGQHRGSSSSHARASVKHRTPAASTSTTTTVAKAPAGTGSGHRVRICPLAGSGIGRGIVGCPPVVPPCGHTLLRWRCWPPCTQWWPCHRPRCDRFTRFNNAASGGSLLPWCWPPPCGGPLKAPTAATPSIMCPLESAATAGASGVRGGVIHRVTSTTGPTGRVSGTVTVLRTASGSPQQVLWQR